MATDVRILYSDVADWKEIVIGRLERCTINKSYWTIDPLSATGFPETLNVRWKYEILLSVRKYSSTEPLTL